MKMICTISNVVFLKLSYCSCAHVVQVLQTASIMPTEGTSTGQCQAGIIPDLMLIEQYLTLP